MDKPEVIAVFITLVGGAINLLWSIFNLRVMASVDAKIQAEIKTLRDEVLERVDKDVLTRVDELQEALTDYCTRSECDGRHKLCDQQYQELCHRMDRAGA